MSTKVGFVEVYVYDSRDLGNIRHDISEEFLGLSMEDAVRKACKAVESVGSLTITLMTEDGDETVVGYGYHKNVDKAY